LKRNSILNDGKRRPKNVRKNQIKLFFVLLFATAFIFSSSHFGALAFEKETKAEKPTNTEKKTDSVNEGNPQNNPSNTEISIEPPIVLSQSVIKLKEIPVDLQTFLEQNSKINITEKSTFSVLNYIQKQNLESLSPDVLSIIASGIYQTILPTNFSIIERNIGNSLPEYDNLGFEAKINFDQNEDFIFLNPDQSLYSIEMEMVDHSLIVSLKGEKSPYQYKIKKEEQSLKPKTIIQYSPLLPTGKVKVKTSGEEGKLVKVYKEIYEGEQLLKREFVSSDYYPPVYRVEIHSLQATSNDSSTQTSNQSDLQKDEETDIQAGVDKNINGNTSSTIEQTSDSTLDKE
jgi:hypothetical protein